MLKSDFSASAEGPKEHDNRESAKERGKDSSLGIASRVSIHDIYQFEVKLEFNLKELQKTNNYKIETYLFVPQSLQIDRYTYPGEQFYANLQNYIRFKTPSYSFKLILDPDFQFSPLYILRQLFKQLKGERDLKKRRHLIRHCVKELKLLGVMIRARLRDFKQFVHRRLKKPDLDQDYLLKRVENMQIQGVAILGDLKRISEDFIISFPEEEELAKYFQVAEEFISHLLEEEIISILRPLKKKLSGDSCLRRICGQFGKYCQGEKKRRRREGFQLLFEDSPEAKEQYIYFMHQYKKIVASVLYLEIMREQEKSTYFHIISSAAAFAAAIIYFATTYFISQSFALNSFPFILLISLGYVFKDRLKDMIKLVLNPRALSRFPDYVTKIKDISEDESTQVGEIREKFFFTRRQNLDPVILSLRDLTRPQRMLSEESHEEVLVYQKEININTEVIRKNHSRTINIVDIMRFNIHRYMEKMDDPEQIINYYDAEEDKIDMTVGERTYHLNMVLKYSQVDKGDEKVRYERYRIVANKWGIVRVEFIKEI